MKLASIQHDGRERVVVAVDDEHLVDVRDLGVDVPDMIGLIGGGAGLLARIADGLAALRARGVPRAGTFEPSAADRRLLIPSAQVVWRPPVRRPGKICGVAMNNSASNARKIKAPDHPAFFLKPASCLVGHLQPIRIYEYYGSTHPEPELAVVVGRGGRQIPREDALNAVFGYTICNDITSNGMRAEDLFHYYALYASKDDPDKLERVEQHLSYAGRYKGSDTFGPLGPWLVTRDEVPNPDDLEVRCRVAGEVVAEDSTRYFNYNVAAVVAFISRFQTLEPGDVISMGTAFKPAPGRKSIHLANLARTAGPVEVTISGLGTLINPVEFIPNS
ncbi:MAG TPA: fumarylacetoacetate hydrolase family protein [Steroidobacteraceae bacterium]|nr:fumarylacetoacetate hydrolase family protein [Steroidobacteraceae bacterium]